ncbi:MAG: sigma-70 family RNA polymerase sigma factor [Planctomycetia bacterium]|nr:sigma-70 family RNA polymerase sigma factor [Planctomycetia bacterium]
MPHMPPTQPSLLVRLKDAHDREAWERFVDLYAPLVFAFVRKRGLQEADAADLTQDVLRQVALSAKSLVYDPKRGSFRSWLFTVVRNRLTDHWRATGRQVAATGDSSQWRAVTDGLTAQDDNADWDAEYERQLFHYAARLIRGDFSEATWAAFWQTAVEGREGKLIAEELGLSVAAVYLAKGRVMTRLKEQVKWLLGDEAS